VTIRTLKLTIAYDGTRFVGWQRQGSGTSIQGLLEDALAPIEGAPVVVHGAGRTDAGVHALAQVASVTLHAGLEEAKLQRALNAVLPPEVRVIEVARAADDFHARFAAREKTYEYRLLMAPFPSPFEYRYVWHVPFPLKLDAMRRALRALVGTHDFAAFQATGSDARTTTRELREARLDERDDTRIALTFTADGFLRHMVRTIVGTVVEVGSGRREAASVADVLASGDRARAGPTAPAEGLFLIRVGY
jgi:tRNA pseudouridine38-40 synthase